MTRELPVQVEEGAYREWPGASCGVPSNVKKKKVKKEVIKRRRKVPDAILALVDPEAAAAATVKTQSKLRRKSTERPDQFTKALTMKPKCGVSVKCDGAPATRQCHHCIKFDHLKKGYYCDACFEARHPPYRATHSWKYLTDAKDGEQDWLRHVARSKLEQDMEELEIMLASTRDFRKEAANLGQEFQKDIGIKKAMNDIARVDGTIKQVIETINHELSFKYRSDNECAVKIQGVWKIRKARKQLREMIRSIYKQFEDPVSKKIYFYNTETNATTWFKPLGLGSEEFIPRRKLLRASDMTPDIAAGYIQRAFRTKLAHVAMQEAVQNTFLKMLDSKTKQFYYINLKTQQVSWTKPKILGGNDIMTPRTKRQYDIDRKAEMKRKAAKLRGPLSPDAAAVVIQCMVRAHRFRHYYRKLISSVYEKIWDERRKKFYYHNTVTKTVSWIRPANVEDSHLLTPRSRKAAVATNPGNETAAAAALVIQNAYRRYNARLSLLKLLASVYQKILDPDSGEYFYYNSKTSDVSWNKPTALGKLDLDEIPKQQQRSRRVYNLSQNDAAIVIHGLFKISHARSLLKTKGREVYRKIVDHETGDVFYYNKATGVSSWKKPAWFGSEDIDEF